MSEQGPIDPPLGEPASPRLVEFFKQDCPSCEKSKVAIEALKQDCMGRRIEVVQVDVERTGNRELVARFGIGAVPTFVALDDTGKERIRFVGTRDLNELRAVAANLVGVCAGVGPGGIDPRVRKGACPGDEPWDGDPQLCGG